MISLSPIVWQQIVEKGVSVDEVPRVDTGVLVTSVFGESPAFKGQMRPGDVIVKIDGQDVKSTQDVR